MWGEASSTATWVEAVGVWAAVSLALFQESIRAWWSRPKLVLRRAPRHLSVQRTNAYVPLHFGLAPLGAEVKARVVGSLGILLNAQAGALRFTRDVPMDGAGQVNFLASVGAGVTVGVSVVGRLNAGYRLTHMSNGGLRYPNPGLDASVWYLGWSH
jgi:hypothetical protein